MSQLLELENEIAAVENQRNATRESVDALTIILVTQEKEIAEKTKHIKSSEAKLYSLKREIEQKQRMIEHIKNKMAEIAARTGVRNSVLHVFLFAVTAESKYFPVPFPG